MDFNKRAKEIESYIIDLRRDFHVHPELSYKETRTSEIVCNELEKMGIPYERVEKNGVVGIIEGKEPGKKIAIRADIDALPMQEENDVPYKSCIPGVMHSCGHDGHTSILLGAAKLLNEAKDEFSGKVFLCFQSAEEVGGGAHEIINYLESHGGVDEVIASHLWADIPSGKISVVKGGRMAGGDPFTVEVTGRGGHGSRPDQCIDPIKPIANILLALSSIPTNRYKTIEPMVVSVCKVQAGTAGNIFPQKATIEGTTRVFSKEGKKKVKEIMQEIVENGAKMYGAQGTLIIRDGVPAIINHEEPVKRAQKVIQKIDGLEHDEFEPICASDNYGYYLEKYKGFMCYIGIRNEEKGIVYAQHHPKFDLDEDVLKNGAAFFAQYACDFLNEK